MKKNSYNKIFQMALATTLATSALVVAIPTSAATISFKDVTDTKGAYYDDITALAQRGYIQGDGINFYPKQEVRRDHAAKIIANVLGLDTKNVADPKFSDVSSDSAFYGDIAALKEAGIIVGDGKGKFLPSKTLTRGEMAKILADAFNLKADGATNPFTDLKNNAFSNYITALYANGVTQGVGNNTYSPNGIVTREQLASFIMRSVRATLPADYTAVKEKYVDTVLGSVTSDTKTVTVSTDADNKSISAAVVGNSLTKAGFESLVDGLIDGLHGTGTSVVLDSVEINGVLYKSSSSVSDLAALTENLAGALNIPAATIAKIVASGNDESILEYLTDGKYTGEVYLNYKDGGREALSINFEVPSK